MTAEPPPAAHGTPVVLRVLDLPDAGASLLVVALTTALRRRGFRVGTAEVHAGLEGTTATVLTTGSGARITLPGSLASAELAARASAFDPGLDLLLVAGAAPEALESGVTTIEVVEVLSAEGPRTPAADLLAVVTPQQLERARAGGGPADDLGLAAIIEERLLTARADTPELAHAAEAPIESARRLLERPDLPPPARAAGGWRRWLGL